MLSNSVLKAWKKQNIQIAGEIHYLLKNYAASVGLTIQEATKKIFLEALKPTRVNLYIDEQDFEEIERLAIKRNLPEAVVIKQAIAEYLAKHSET